jgi:hypothetical protein
MTKSYTYHHAKHQAIQLATHLSEAHRPGIGRWSVPLRTLHPPRAPWHVEGHILGDLVQLVQYHWLVDTVDIEINGYDPNQWYIQ